VSKVKVTGWQSDRQNIVSSVVVFCLTLVYIIDFNGRSWLFFCLSLDIVTDIVGFLLGFLLPLAGYWILVKYVTVHSSHELLISFCVL